MGQRGPPDPGAHLEGEAHPARLQGPQPSLRNCHLLGLVKEVLTFSKIQNVKKGHSEYFLITQSNQASTNNEKQTQGVIWGYRAFGVVCCLPYLSNFYLIADICPHFQAVSREYQAYTVKNKTSLHFSPLVCFQEKALAASC